MVGIVTAIAVGAAAAGVITWAAAAMIAFSTIMQQRQAEKMREEQAKMAAEAEARADAAKGVRLVIDGETASLKVVYGRQLVGGVKVYHNTFDSYVNAGLQPGVGGQVFKASDVLDANVGGKKHEFLITQQALCVGGINACYEVDIDERRITGEYVDAFEQVTYDGSGTKVEYYGYGLKVHFYPQGGHADPLITANESGRAGAVFTNTAYATVVYRLNRDDPQFSSSAPTATFYVEGMKIKTILGEQGGRYLSTTKVYSNNPALCLLDYLTNTFYGRGLDVSFLDLDSFYEAYLKCEMVVKPNVPKEGKLWRNNGSARDVKLYECNLGLDTSNAIRDNVQTILETMPEARLIWSGGKYKLLLKYPKVHQNGAVYNFDEYVQNGTTFLKSLVNSNNHPLVADNIYWKDAVDAYIDDNNIVRDEKNVVSWPNSQSRLNYCTVRFLNEAKDFKEDQVVWPPKDGVLYANYLAEDNGEPLESELFATGVTDYYSALARAEHMVRLSRAKVSYTLSVDKDFIELEPGDITKVESNVLGIPGELMMVDEVQPTSNGAIELSLVKYVPEAFAWNVEDTEDVPSRNIYDNNLPNVIGSSIKYNPISFDVVNSGGVLSWDPVNDNRVAGYIIQTIDDSEFNFNNSLWTYRGYVEGTEFTLPPLYDGNYYVTVIATDATGRKAPKSGWPTKAIGIVTVANEVVALKIYRRSATPPARPTDGSYDFVFRTLSPPAGWSSTVPNGTDPLYASEGYAARTNGVDIDTYIEWSAPELDTVSRNSFLIEVFTRDPNPNVPSGGSYTFPIGPAAPPTSSNATWHLTVPVGFAACYVSYGVAYSPTGTGLNTNTILWTDPRLHQEEAATRVADLYLYKWSISVPSTAGLTSEYNWITSENTNVSGLTWTVTPPANPGTPNIKLWMIRKTIEEYVGVNTTPVDWSSAVPEDVTITGAEGSVKYSKATIYKWAITIPEAPSGSSTYYWATDSLDTVPTGWQAGVTSITQQGTTLWKAEVSLLAGTSAISSTVNWVTASISAISYAGIDGTIYYLQSNADIISRSSSGTHSPATVTVSSKSKTGNNSVVPLIANFKYYTKTTPTGNYGAATSSANVSSVSINTENVYGIKVEIYSDVNYTVLLDSTEIPLVNDGTSALTVTLSNPSHTVASDADGANTVYTASGTTIKVFEGSNALTYTTGTHDPGKFIIGTPTVSGVTITPGARSGNGTTTATVADHSGMTNGATNLVSAITYPITAKRANGETVAISVTQTITKSLRGTNGIIGADAKYVVISGNQVFQYASNSSTPANTSVTLSAALYGGLTVYDWEYWNGTAWVDLSGTQNLGSYTLQHNNAAFTGDQLRVRCLSTAASGDVYDEVTILKVRDGSNALVSYLTNESHTVASENDGTGYSLTGATGSMKVFLGVTDVSGSATYAVSGAATKNGLTVAINSSGVYSVSGTGWTTDTETFSFTATYSGSTQTKQFTISKARRGANGYVGADAKYVVVTGDQIFQYASGASTPNNVNVTLAAVLYGGLTTYDWEYWNGTAWANLQGTQNQSSYTLAYNATAFTGDQIRIRCKSSQTVNSVTTDYWDEITVVKLRDGDNALSGFLTNESHTVTANTDGTGYSLTTAGGNFKVFFGLDDVSSLTSFSGGSTKNGLTFSIDANGAYTLSGASWTSDSESFTITATYNGASFSKTYSISKAKKGVAGITGNSYRTAYAKSTVATASTVAGVTTAGSASFPSTQYGLGAVSWGSSVPALDADEFLYQLDGVFNPTDNTTYWGDKPYWSSLKVGSLSAITANLGSITSGSITGTDIKSSNFSAGSAGWQITAAGNAEFNSGTYRGQLDVKSATSGSRLEITGSRIRVYDGTTLRVVIGDLS